MNNKINEFIEELLPSDITPDKKENLRQELECHILEAIDFYEENGFSYEKSVEKALSDFCSDEKTKQTIKNKFANLHSENSIASIIKKIIIFYVPTNIILHLFGRYMINTTVIVNAIIIPLIFYLIFTIIDKNKKLKKSVRSAISIFVALFLIFQSYLTLLFSFSDLIYVTQNETKIDFSEKTIEYRWEPDIWADDYDPDGYDSFTKSFIPTEFKNFDNVDIYTYDEEHIFHEAGATTYIFNYKDNETYLNEKNNINETYSYFDDSLTLYDFDFKYFSAPLSLEHNGKTYINSWYDAELYIIGTNDKTNQISFTIHYGGFYDYKELETPITKEVLVDGEKLPIPFNEIPDENSIDEYFYKNYCGWKYISFFNFFLK